MLPMDSSLTMPLFRQVLLCCLAPHQNMGSLKAWWFQSSKRNFTKEKKGGAPNSIKAFLIFSVTLAISFSLC